MCGWPTGSARRLPAYATALGKALLADRFGADRDAHIPQVLDPLTPHTITDRDVLDTALAEVMVRGYAADDQENTEGVRCFAVTLRYAMPAQDAISASVPLARLTPAREAQIVEALRTVCDKVSRVVRPVANGDRVVRAVIPKSDAVTASIDAMKVLDVHRTRS